MNKYNVYGFLTLCALGIIMYSMEEDFIILLFGVAITVMIVVLSCILGEIYQEISRRTK